MKIDSSFSLSSHSLKPLFASRYFSVCIAILVLAFLSWIVLALSTGANIQHQPVSTEARQPTVLEPASTELSTSAVSQGKPVPLRIPTEIVTILPDGFDLQVIKRPQGPFFLMVDNRSGLKDVSLRLDREFGIRLREVAIPQAAPDWDGLLDLPAGEYLLTEANNPDWGCRIIITSN